tara:strand:+ start:541 stop:792 length:252 start_codon:yes stop_codon:yes gene_type:complete
MTSTTIGQQIAGRRSQLGLSQLSVAAAAKVTMSTLRRIETGDNVRFSSLLHVLEVLGCELSLTPLASSADSEAQDIPCPAPRT